MKKFDKEATMLKGELISDKVPKKCQQCGSEKINYWDETDEEIIFKCLDCLHFYPVPFNTDKLHSYFNF